MVSGSRMSGSKRSWLPHEVAQRLRREMLLGLLLVVVSLAVIVVIALLTDPVTWQIGENGSASLSDGAPCELFRVAEVDAEPGFGATMLDCGPRAATSTPVLVQQLFSAAGAAGALLLVGSSVARFLARRMPHETLAVPALAVGAVAGVALVWWGLRARGQHLVYEVADGVITSSVLAGDPSFSGRDAAVAAGFGLVAASLVRIVRP